MKNLASAFERLRATPETTNGSLCRPVVFEKSSGAHAFEYLVSDRLLGKGRCYVLPLNYLGERVSDLLSALLSVSPAEVFLEYSISTGDTPEGVLEMFSRLPREAQGYQLLLTVGPKLHQKLGGLFAVGCRDVSLLLTATQVRETAVIHGIDYVLALNTRIRVCRPKMEHPIKIFAPDIPEPNIATNWAYLHLVGAKERASENVEAARPVRSHPEGL
jgi:hypothetical protein